MDTKLPIVVSAGVGIGALIYALRTRNENKTLRKAFRILKYRDHLKTESEKVSIEPLFFPDDRIICRNFLLEGSCKDENCSYCHDEMAPLTRLIRLIQNAKEYIDLAGVLKKFKNIIK